MYTTFSAGKRERASKAQYYYIMLVRDGYFRAFCSCRTRRNEIQAKRLTSLESAEILGRTYSYYLMLYYTIR